MTDNYPDNKEYLLKTLMFLKEYQWIYNYPNTHILVNQILKYFKEEWLYYLKNVTNQELNDLPFGYGNKSWPEGLIALIKQLQSFHIEHYNSINGALHNAQTNFIGISLKKQHEIISLAATIDNECSTKDISFIIDIGAGLGYLSQLLYDKYNYKVLAIEGNPNTFELALKNQNHLYSHSTNFVRYVNHFITKDSSMPLKKFLREYFDNWCEETDSVCITGLHACADLSVTILDIFIQLSFVKSLIIMPCCYHRLELENVTANEERFKSFPISNALLTSYNSLEGGKFLKRPFLRLACQQSSGSWKNMTIDEHKSHSKNFMFRAVLQEVAEKENCEVKRVKRRTGKLNKTGSNLNIEEYIDNLKITHELVSRNESNSKSIDDIEFKSKIREKWNEHKEDCYLVEILTAFQTTMQSMCENIILLDRVEYLREKGLKCDVYKVTDDRISPRCHALVATKL